MASTADRLLDEALKLAPDERARIVAELLGGVLVGLTALSGAHIYPVVWYSTRPASVTRREASRISSDTRSPAAS